LERLYKDCGYLGAIAKEIGRPELYYSYGIPLYFKFGRINWFHLSNVLPLRPNSVHLSLLERLKASYLGKRIRAGLANADVISAESRCSLDMLGASRSERLFLSVNGSDDELLHLQNGYMGERQNVAMVVGTASYKALGESFRVFEILRNTNVGLKLVVIGNPEWVPKSLKGRRDVVIRGLLQRSEVIEALRSASFYISTTRIENSYNAAAEGIFLAEESYISDIGPHRELLRDMDFEEVSVTGVGQSLLHVRRVNLTPANLRSWETVVTQMIERFHEAMRDGGVAPSIRS
jgi:hypothetical protein